MACDVPGCVYFVNICPKSPAQSRDNMVCCEDMFLTIPSMLLLHNNFICCMTSNAATRKIKFDYKELFTKFVYTYMEE